METLFHQPLHPGHLALCSPPSFSIASSWKGVSVQPGNILSWNMEEIFLCVSPHFIPTTLPGSSE